MADPNATLHQLLIKSAQDVPERIAVVDPEREKTITYEAFDSLTDRIKDHLIRIGVREGDRVGVYIPKSIGSLASIFGILKSGAAYIPVDPTAPASRNAFIFQDCTVRSIILDASLLDNLNEEFGDHVTIKSEHLAFVDEYGIELALVEMSYQDNVPAETEVEHLAYILYTSGSTGKPKGVMHSHASGLSFVQWCADTVGFSEEDVFSSHAPFHFDLSILDIYVPIMHGATLVLIGESLGKQPARLAPVIADRNISIWYSTPSILRLLLEYGDLESYTFDALRVVFFAGEVFPIKHLRALKERWPHPKYFNLYGPTETNVCTYYELPDSIPDSQVDPFPIGPVCENDKALVLNHDDAPAGKGEEGELLITGGSVMKGYWNLPQRSASAYYVDPDGTRWYKTGDIVVESEEDGFIFVGRRDRMVKRRGYRVELGEIESALYRHPEIKEAAVIALPNEENGMLIKAFLSGSDTMSKSLIAMKKFCADHLPLYMIPDRFSFQPSLPKTSTDKINYQQLKEID